MRWHRIDQESCYDNDEAKGGRERTQEKSGLKFRNTLHTQTQTRTYIWKQVHHSQRHVCLELWCVQGPASNAHILLSELSTLYRAVLRTKIAVAAVHRSVLIIKFRPDTSFMFHYRFNMTTSIHHLILFIMLAIALSALWLAMLAFNIAECYIMIMTVGVLRCCLHLIMAEWNGSIYQRRLNQEFSVHVGEQTAQGDQSAQMLKASCSVSISPSYTHLFLIAACTSTDFWSEQHFWLRNSIDSLSACDPSFPRLALVINFVTPYFFSSTAGRRASRQAAVGLSLGLI